MLNHFFPQLKCSVYISDAVMFVASVSTNLTCKGREGERDLIWVGFYASELDNSGMIKILMKLKIINNFRTMTQNTSS